MPISLAFLTLTMRRISPRGVQNQHNQTFIEPSNPDETFFLIVDSCIFARKVNASENFIGASEI